MSKIAIKQMVEWLKERIRRDTKRLKHLESLGDKYKGMVAENQRRFHLGQSIAYGDEAFLELSRRMIAVYESRAALEGPGEEERKEMVRHWNAHIANYSTRTCPVCIKIFNLVMGKGAEDA